MEFQSALAAFFFIKSDVTLWPLFSSRAVLSVLIHSFLNLLQEQLNTGYLLQCVFQEHFSVSLILFPPLSSCASLHVYLPLPSSETVGVPSMFN